MAFSKQSRIAFLVGSGISICAGMPKTNEITEKVLSGHDIYYHDGYFSSQKHHFTINRLEQEQVEIVQILTKFLHRLKKEVEEFYKKRKFKPDIDPDIDYEANYEDLYYIAFQIYDNIVGEYANPAVQPLVNKIESDIKPLINQKILQKLTIHKLADMSLKYIEYVVFHLLNPKSKDLTYLRCIKQACEDIDFSKVDIFSLNHDIVLERFIKQFLNQEKIKFTDGFFKPDKEENRYWKPDLYNYNCFNVRLFKLHGSINWFRCCPEEAVDWSDEFVAIPRELVNYHFFDKDGNSIRVREKMLLIGTYNKILGYAGGIFRELQYQFYRSLRDVNRLVICGYGLEDRGINNQIIDWLFSSNNSRIILIDPEPEKLKNKYLSSISNKWDLLIDTKRLKVLQKGIEIVSWG